jgi:hypothetical protein
MSATRRLVIAGLVLFLCFSLFHAFRPYGWSGQTAPPPGVAIKNVSYTCAAPWEAGYVHGPATTPYPLSGTPCSERSQYQIMLAVDVFLVALALGVALSWRRKGAAPA